MGRKITTYKYPSLLTQIQNGYGTKEQAETAYKQLQEGKASPKTLRRIRKAIDERVFWAP